MEDLEGFENAVLSRSNGGIEDFNHPAFTDMTYLKRKDEITSIAKNYKFSHKEIPRVNYTPAELQTWKTCFTGLKKLHREYACREFLEAQEEFKTNFNFTEHDIPQQEDISQFLQSKTGWRLKPVSGLLEQKAFLNGLAFRVYHCTQYIRHHENPFYSVEPDLVHEYLGHAPMFAVPDFAEFSQMIGIASLGASEEDIKKLGSIYWYTVEFGLCKENDQIKACGAAILGGISDLQHTFSGKPKFVPLNFEQIFDSSFKIADTKAETYFVAESFSKAKE